MCIERAGRRTNGSPSRAETQGYEGAPELKRTDVKRWGIFGYYKRPQQNENSNATHRVLRLDPGVRTHARIVAVRMATSGAPGLYCAAFPGV